MRVKRLVWGNCDMPLTEKTAVFCAVLGRELRRRRIAAGLSLNRLAEMSGLSQPMIGFIEKGTSVPTVASLYRIARALGVAVGEIVAAVEMAMSETKVR
jgi:transcriptional regulator with XRE-family HTH domain